MGIRHNKRNQKLGAYWGNPANLYWITNGEGVQLFTRADSRKAAMQEIEKKHPEIQWKRNYK
jgi:hypothetical protein